jgi:hypothetical protein
MQKNHRLSLDEIRELLEKGGQKAHLSKHLKSGDSIFRSEQDRAVLDTEMVCQASGLSTEQLQALLDTRLLMPLQDGSFDDEDLRMAQACANTLAWGLQIESLRFYVELGDIIIENEFALRRRIIVELPAEMDASVTLQMLDDARFSRNYILERIFQRRIAEMNDLKAG